MFRPRPGPSIYPVVEDVFRSYQRPNAELYVNSCKRRYGELSQQDIIDTIAAADSRLKLITDQSGEYKTIMQRAWKYRVWFLCQEWMDNGFFNENTCVYYRRKFQDSQITEGRLLDIAYDYQGDLYGYPGSIVGSIDYMIDPKDKDKATFMDLLDRTNWDAAQWGYLPAILSDIRIWPLRYKLPIDNTVPWPNPEPWVCVPGAW